MTEQEHLAALMASTFLATTHEERVERGTWALIARAVLAAGYERRRDECLDPYGRPLFDESAERRRDVAEADALRKQVRG